MKKMAYLVVFLVCMLVSGSAFAADKIGMYVAPKFVYGFTQMDGMKAHGQDSSDFEWGSMNIGHKDDSAFGGSLALGYDFSCAFDVPIRAELEYAAFSKVSGKKSTSGYDAEDDFYWGFKAKQEFSIQTLFVNAYYDFTTGTAWTPYVGAGLGMAFIDTKGKFSDYDSDLGPDTAHYSSSSKTVTNFAWNIGAGLGYALTDSWTLDAGYRFVGLGSAKSKTASDQYEDLGDVYTYRAHVKTRDLYMHQVAVGLRYTF